jgi:hypothetical protein
MIREFKPSDLEQILRIHEGAGRPFKFPNLTHPLMVVKKCTVDDEDQVRLACFGRLHVSALLFVDKLWKTPRERMEGILELQREMTKEAGEKYGLDIATTQMEGRFAERMKDFGWNRGHGEMYYREI